MADSLTVLADSVADTLAQATGGLNAFNQVLVCVAIASILVIAVKAVKFLIKNKAVVTVKNTPELERRLCIRELLWVVANVLAGGVVLAASWNKEVAVNSRLLAVMATLAVFTVLSFAIDYIYRREFALRDSIAGLVENMLSQVLWVFWLVLAGFYIASEVMDFSWDDVAYLWQNRAEYADRIREDLCAVLIVVFRVFFVIAKHKRRAAN